MTVEILNSKGEPIKLNQAEKARASVLQRQFDRELKNSLGFNLDITTLTTILKSVTEQKFYTIPFADYMPVVVGEGSWSTQLTKYVSFQTGDAFSTGILNTGADNSRLASVDTGVEAVNTPVNNWAKEISWSIMDLNLAARSGSWDLVTEKEKSRKTNWDLGLQEIAFWGSTALSTVKGLLTQSGVNSNTSLITKYISSMTATEFQSFLAGLLPAYRTNSSHTAYPTHFLIPEADYNGLATATDETYPLKTRLDRILDAMKLLTMNPNFKVLPSAYADKAVNAAVTGLNKNRYALYRYDGDTMRMDLPVDYTSTLQNTINGFFFQNVGYGQFTGVTVYRPKEVLYFDFS